MAHKFQPGAKLEAYHANIKDSQFNVDWFSKFDVVFNALDNLDARRHVNKMCLAADVPLIESGTTGFNGQVQVIKKVRLSSYVTVACRYSFIPGQNGVLRLQPKGGSEVIPCLHDPQYSQPAHPLHCLG